MMFTYTFNSYAAVGQPTQPHILHIYDNCSPTLPIVCILEGRYTTPKRKFQSFDINVHIPTHHISCLRRLVSQLNHTTYTYLATQFNVVAKEVPHSPSWPPKVFPAKTKELGSICWVPACSSGAHEG